MTNKPIPKMIASGYLSSLDNIPCYNLDNGQRVFRFRDMTHAIRGAAHGKFGNYLATENIRKYVPERLRPEDTPERTPRGITEADINGQIVPTYDATDFIDVCIAFIEAAEHGEKLSIPQQGIVERARRFVIASAKTGITGLIDEATGYQNVRPANALDIKMAFFLADELRPWEKTFPDQFWVELGRLTGWTDIKRRPKYWGKLVIEFIYEALDRDVAKYLQETKPPKYTGQKYHQWLEENRGVRALTEHIWTVIGLAKTCESIDDLRYEINKQFSKDFFQPMLFASKKVGRLPETTVIEPEKQDFDDLLDKAIKPSQSDS